MSTPPIAKEPEVTGLNEVREKLEEARHLIQSGGVGEKAMLAMRHGAIAKITEALAFMESEQGEQIVIRADHAGESGVGIPSYIETVTVSFGDPGGEPGEFQAFIIEALSEWFDGARVMLESEAIEEDRTADAILAPTESEENNG